MMIQVENLVKTYQTNTAVAGISFQVQEGMLFSFLGTNGAGKSTTINILTTLLSKTSGRAEVGGYDISTRGNKVRELIGIVFQDTVLDAFLTPTENLTIRGSLYGFSGKKLKDAVSRVIAITDIGDFANRPYRNLSGGQKRRVDIARALIHTPKLLFLDEPTTGLHFADVKQLMEVIQRLVDQGNTVVMIEHNMDVLLQADYLIDLGPEGGDRGGELIFNGSPEEIAGCEISYTGVYLKDFVDRKKTTNARTRRSGAGKK